MEKTPTSCVSSLRMTICVWTSGIASRKPTPPCTLQCEKTLGASSAGAATAFSSSRRGADVWSAATAGGAFTRSAERAPAGRAARAMDHTALRMSRILLLAEARARHGSSCRLLILSLLYRRSQSAWRAMTADAPRSTVWRARCPAFD